ncbi:CheR family methyltransferase [Sporomusa termitida]|uniref:Chemotaxis protein methyltransferase n=1 Tax=Sporomusa termitida TaxID=2377 RepID=A0A517DQJ9_9FIRM|nr:protein-glutamate O-methyltransferase CheR [Sporomusa termitida]QDR79631.1 Chemotaxis protein methyltransferase [Sporomusa termitida]
MDKEHACDTVEKIEIQLFLEGVFRLYGYDFRDYASASMRRRILQLMEIEKVSTVSELQSMVLHHEKWMERLLMAVSVNVTAMFRDPPFYTSFREKVLPLLASLPLIRIWHVGCSTGEEVYSMAILLKEAGLYDKAKIYATDINEVVLNKAKNGIYPLSLMKEYTDNYIMAKCGGVFSQYYTADDKNAVFNEGMRKKIIWAQHNLVTDSSFNEFDVILCRNVMIYFNKSLQNKVHELLYGSLKANGILGLGTAETLRFTVFENRYKELDRKMKLFQKVM